MELDSFLRDLMRWMLHIFLFVHGGLVSLCGTWLTKETIILMGILMLRSEVLRKAGGAFSLFP